MPGGVPLRPNAHYDAHKHANTGLDSHAYLYHYRDQHAHAKRHANAHKNGNGHLHHHPNLHFLPHAVPHGHADGQPHADGDALPDKIRRAELRPYVFLPHAHAVRHFDADANAGAVQDVHKIPDNNQDVDSDKNAHSVAVHNQDFQRHAESEPHGHAYPVLPGLPKQIPMRNA